MRCFLQSSILLGKMTGYVRGVVTKYEKNITDVPEIFGRLIVGLFEYFDNADGNTGGISMQEVDRLLRLIYRKTQNNRRRDYYRKFVNNNRSFLENFIIKKQIHTNREDCE